MTHFSSLRMHSLLSVLFVTFMVCTLLGVKVVELGMRVLPALRLCKSRGRSTEES